MIVPGILGVMAAMMLQAPQHIIDTYSIPPEVIDEAYTNNPEHKRNLVESLAKIRSLCEELGLMTPDATRMWEQAGLLPD